jgi:hypothetical protein
MKQTAVEWLIEQVNHKGVVYNNYHIITDIPKEIIDQAKAMEKEQIENAYDCGLFDGGDDVSPKYNIDSQQYYNQTYGGDK